MLIRLALRKPDFAIGNQADPYLKRWYIFPPKAKYGLNVYLHQILKSDDDRALHDHPWWNISIVLKGGYVEHLPGGVSKWRGPGSIIFRKATAAHRLQLSERNVINDAGAYSKIIPCWSIFITGKWQRVWGFHCPQGFIGWRPFHGIPDGVEPKGDEIGPGCGEVSQ